MTVRPRTTLFTADECRRIVEDACRVLATVGVIVESDEGRKHWLAAGGEAKGDRLVITEEAVRAAVDTAPGAVTLYDRDGGRACELAGDAVHFDPGSAAINIIDRKTGRRRTSVTGDLVELARLTDGLPNYAAQATALVSGDVPETIGDRYRLYLALLNCSKPVVTGTFAVDGFSPMLQMQLLFRADAADLAARPMTVFDCCPSPPLKWSELTCRCLIDCARSGVPAELVSMPLTGATSPVTLRDAVVQHCAESLSGLVIHQAAGPGAPIIYGGAPSAFDMRHGSTPMGAMETMMIGVGYAQVGKALGLPTHGYLGLSDAKAVDYQAGMESGIGTVLAALAGINLVSGAGILDYILTQSLEKLLLDHEACGMALRLVRGIAIRDEDAVDLIGGLVATGEALSSRHTRTYWRQELSVPSPLIDRESYGDWEAAGATTAAARARQRVETILAGEAGSPPSEEEAAALREIMLAEARRAGLDELPA